MNLMSVDKKCNNWKCYVIKMVVWFLAVARGLSLNGSIGTYSYTLTFLIAPGTADAMS